MIEELIKKLEADAQGEQSQKEWSRRAAVENGRVLLPAKKGRIGCVQISAGLLPIRDEYGMRLDAS